MLDYYAKRASEHDKVYEKPERQKDLAEIKNILSSSFVKNDVLEIACGTGYWTQYISNSAKSIIATDYNIEVINIAKKRKYGDCKVDFIVSDAYKLDGIANHFTGCFYGFWWSHIPLQKLSEFLNTLHTHLKSGSKVIVIDNSYIESSSTPISRRDEFGNSFQKRVLENGKEFEILKNFPSADNIKSTLTPYVSHASIKQFQYYWLAEYIIK